ncbi:MAG TPA: type II CAAX endopeptidase family protein [Anaerolineales bacterium]|nr:type II CAAX endopeptidase family protein [Anaerolineales bacterium]
MAVESSGITSREEPAVTARGWALAVYFGLTFLITWGIQLVLIASENGWGGLSLPPTVHYLAPYGPMLAAIVATAWIGRSAGLKELWSRIVRWRVGWGWFAIALLSPAALFAVGVAVSVLLGGELPDLALVGQVNYMPPLGLLGAWIFWFLTYGMGEEIGWRGFALPRLQHGRTAGRATLILGIFWALWHLPAFFYLDTYQAMGLWMYPFLAITIICGSVVYTWIYNSTGGSVLMAIIFHASFNTFSASAAGAGTTAVVMSAGIVLASLIIPRVYGLEDFSPRARHML